MRAYVLTHVRDDVLLHDLTALLARERATTAEVLAHIAEVDARKLYLPAAYPSMHAYCVGELHLSEDAAYKRIQAARAARRFPVLFEALAEGRLHLTGVGLLAPYLTLENVDELVAAATHRRKAEIETWLARRFGPEGSHWVAGQLAPAQVAANGFLAGPTAQLAPDQAGTGGFPTGSDIELAPAQVGANGFLAGPTAQLAPGQVATPSPDRILIHLAIGERTHAKLCHAQALLSHALPSGDVALVLDRALDALIEKLEKRKFAASARPRGGADGSPPEGSPPEGALPEGALPEGPLPRRQIRRPSPLPRTNPNGGNPRALPAHVRRAVWERDGGRCTFRSDSGHSCGSRRFLEFDHVEPVARGGRATIAGLRLRCRAHNQYEAERVFGSEFMHRKRQRSLGARSRALPCGKSVNCHEPAAVTDLGRPAAPQDRPGRAMHRPVADHVRAADHAPAGGHAPPAADCAPSAATAADHSPEIWSALRTLGFRAGEVLRGCEYAATLGDAPLEERLRAAIQLLGRGLALGPA